MQSAICQTSSFFSMPRNLGTLFSNGKRQMSGDASYCCSLNNNPEKRSSMSMPVCYAVAAYIDGLSTSVTNKVSGFVGHPHENSYIAEYKHSDGTIDVCVWNINGELRAGKSEPGIRNVILPPNPVGRGGNANDVIVYILAMLPFLMARLPEVETAMRELISYANVTDICDASLIPTANEDMLRDFFVISDAVYCALRDGVLKCNIPRDNNVDALSMESSDAFGIDDDDAIIAGTPEFWARSRNTTTSGKKEKAPTIVEVKKDFAFVFANRNWSDAEKALIPTFPDDFPVPSTVIKMAHRYAASKDSKRPAVNFGWRGPTSIGKSTGVEILACILNIPLVHMTCYPDMETSNFMSEFVPDTTQGKSIKELPTFIDIFDDPVEAYKNITGEENNSATCDMCLEAYANALAAAKSDAPRFRHVESQYVRALRNGWMVEIAEPSRIRDAGTLVGLNGVDKPGAIVDLMDGSSFRRHEDAIVVFTDNVGYVSCRPMDNAVIRRLSFIIDSSKLSKKELFSRTKYNTGFSKRDMLEKMYTVFSSIEKYCQENDITGGSVSPTEFEMWALFVKGDDYANLRENCIDCVVSKATDDPDLQKEIISACVDRFLT